MHLRPVVTHAADDRPDASAEVYIDSVGLTPGTPQCVDLVFKLSYGNMLYIGKSGHFTLKWPNFP